MASNGDPRVLLVLNLVLSAAFVYVVLWGLDVLGAVEFTILRFVAGTLLLALITHVVTR